MNSRLLTTSLLALCLSASAFAAALPESARIDSILAKDWQKNGLKANPAATDEIFVRRLYLDVAGRIPTIDEARSFIDSKEAGKRTKLIDTLLASEGYVSHYFNYWADVLRVLTDTKGALAGTAYAEFLKDALRKNKPFDQLTRELVTADGAAWEGGAMGFYMRDQGMPLDHLVTTVQVFLGTSIVCAQCHNHPFDKWSQMDYYHMAAFTFGVQSKGYGLDMKAISGDRAAVKKDPAKRAQMRVVTQSLQEVMKPLRYTMIRSTDALPKLPHDYKYNDAKPNERVEPRTMFGHDATPAEGEDRRAAFAKWMTSPENPRFTIVIANRMWKQAMGLALIEPLDEMMDSTVASNPELMDYLSQLMIEKKYDMKAFLRVVLNSDTYQHTASTKGVALGETYHFTGPLLRRMTAEQTWDSLVTLLTGNPDNGLGEPNQSMEHRLANLGKLYNTLAGKTVEELLADSKNLSAVNAKLDAKAENLRKKMEAAKKAGDEALAKQLSKELVGIRNDKAKGFTTALLGAEVANEITGGKGLYKKSPKKGPVPVLAVKRPSAEELEKAGLTREQIEQKLAEFKQPVKGGRKGMGNIAGRSSPLIRASEESSPSPRGHLLRLFGQSDRETISNASTEATVPQALGLLNGNVAEAVYGPASFFRQTVGAAPTADEQMDAIYLGLLSRKPTDDERTVLASVAKDRPDTGINDVIHALLNTTQFLFVQ